MGRPVWTPEMVETLKALMAKGLTNQAIADEMGLSKESVAHTRRRYKLTVPRTFSLRPAPDDFASLAPRLTINGACERWKVSEALVKRWYKDASIAPRQRRQNGGTPWSVAMETPRDDSGAGQAQRELQRFGPVFKVKTLYPADKSPDYIAHGRRMSPEAMIDMASARLERAA